jgi:hypothetical protein
MIAGSQHRFEGVMYLDLRAGDVKRVLPSSSLPFGAISLSG